ncbi:hypothetical protein N9W04_03095 [Alphaproteobacteria bacterium]|jgi:hypothetical protein|nr:hypothetical protein [Alphaproteobacteria bacterium]MDB2636505.1 hypothetical protein [Alphaproteobacteria bacterium]
MNKLLYLIFSLFLLRGFVQIFNGGSWTLGWFSILMSVAGLIFLKKKYNQKYISGLLIFLLLSFMMSH